MSCNVSCLYIHVIGVIARVDGKSRTGTIIRIILSGVPVTSSYVVVFDDTDTDHSKSKSQSEHTYKDADLTSIDHIPVPLQALNHETTQHLIYDIGTFLKVVSGKYTCHITTQRLMQK